MASALLLKGDMRDKPADPIHVAVIWVEKAQSGSIQWSNDATEAQIRAYRFKKRLKPVTDTAKYLLLGLAIFEVPTYCLLDKANCPGPSRPDLYGFGLFQFPSWASNYLAILIWLYFFAMLFVRRKALGAAHVFTNWHTFGTVLILISLADCIVGVFQTVGIFGAISSSFRVSRFFRPLVFLCYTRSLRSEAARVVKAIPQFLDVFAALAICILFFTWVGLIMFAESAEGVHFFSNWTQAMTNLWILFTTANCPDVFVLAYDKHRFHFLFFLVFIIISVYLLSNVLLASVYESYKEQLKAMVMEYYANQRLAIAKAFQLLADHQGDVSSIGPEKFERFFTHLCDSSLGGSDHAMEHSEDQKYNKTRANAIFNELDRDNTKGINMTEFNALLDVVFNAEEYIPRKSPVESKKGWVKRLKHIFQNGIFFRGEKLISFDALVDCVVAVDVSIVFYQTILFVNGSGQFDERPLQPDRVWYWALLAFSCFYVTTVTLKIVVFGFERFWYLKPVQNRYDFFNVYGVFLAELTCLYMTHVSKGGAPSWVLRFVVLMHITRSLRVLPYIQPLKYIAEFMVRLAPTYKRMGMVLVVVYYLYATVGEQIFGGKIYAGNSALKGSDYVAANYWTVNFNDFSSSMGSLFILMVVNNWFVITDACMRVTGKWAAVYFVSFFVIVNMIVLNILMALILDCSGAVRQEMEEEAVEEANIEEGGHHTTSPKKHNLNYQAVLRQVLLADENFEAELERTTSGISRMSSAASQPSYGAVTKQQSQDSFRRRSVL